MFSGPCGICGSSRRIWSLFADQTVMPVDRKPCLVARWYREPNHSNLLLSLSMDVSELSFFLDSSTHDKYRLLASLGSLGCEASFPAVP